MVTTSKKKMSTPHSNHLHQFVNSPVLQREQQSQDDKPTKRQKPPQKIFVKNVEKEIWEENG